MGTSKFPYVDAMELDRNERSFAREREARYVSHFVFRHHNLSLCFFLLHDRPASRRSLLSKRGVEFRERRHADTSLTNNSSSFDFTRPSKQNFQKFEHKSGRRLSWPVFESKLDAPRDEERKINRRGSSDGCGGERLKLG